MICEAGCEQLDRPSGQLGRRAKQDSMTRLMVIVTGYGPNVKPVGWHAQPDRLGVPGLEVSPRLAWHDLLYTYIWRLASISMSFFRWALIEFFLNIILYFDFSPTNLVFCALVCFGSQSDSVIQPFIFSSPCRSGPLLFTAADGPVLQQELDENQCVQRGWNSSFFAVSISGLFFLLSFVPVTANMFRLVWVVHH